MFNLIQGFVGGMMRRGDGPGALGSSPPPIVQKFTKDLQKAKEDIGNKAKADDVAGDIRVVERDLVQLGRRGGDVSQLDEAKKLLKETPPQLDKVATLVEKYVAEHADKLRGSTDELRRAGAEPEGGPQVQQETVVPAPNPTPTPTPPPDEATKIEQVVPAAVDQPAVNEQVKKVLDGIKSDNPASIDAGLKALSALVSGPKGIDLSEADKKAIRSQLGPVIARQLPTDASAYQKLSNDGVKWMQRGLYVADICDGDHKVRNIGGDKGMVDGMYGNRTRASLTDFEKSQGMGPSTYAEIQPKLAAYLTADQAAPAAVEPPKPEPPATPQQQVAQAKESNDAAGRDVDAALKLTNVTDQTVAKDPEAAARSASEAATLAQNAVGEVLWADELLQKGVDHSADSPDKTKANGVFSGTGYIKDLKDAQAAAQQAKTAADKAVASAKAAKDGEGGPNAAALKHTAQMDATAAVQQARNAAQLVRAATQSIERARVPAELAVKPPPAPPPAPKVEPPPVQQKVEPAVVEPTGPAAKPAIDPLAAAKAANHVPQEKAQAFSVAMMSTEDPQAKAILPVMIPMLTAREKGYEILTDPPPTIKDNQVTFSVTKPGMKEPHSMTLDLAPPPAH